MVPLFLSNWALAAISGVQIWAGNLAAAVLEENFSASAVISAPAVCNARMDQFLMAVSDEGPKKPSYNDLLPPTPFDRPDEFLKAWEALPPWVTMGLGEKVKLVAGCPDAMQVLRRVVQNCQRGVTLNQVRHTALAVSNFVRSKKPKEELTAARVGGKLFTPEKEEPAVWDETFLTGLVEWSGSTPKGVTLYLKTPIG